jgi:hypothetical protein
VGQGKQEAFDMTRGGRGRTMQGKRVADNTTRGLLSRRQKMVEPPHAGVHQRWRRRASVTVAPGEGGAGTYRRQSRVTINDEDEDTASKNNCNHNVVFFAMVVVGAYNVVCGGDGGGDSSGGSWLQLVVNWGVPEEEDQMTAWQAEPATEQEDACRALRGGGTESSLSLELLDYVGRPWIIFCKIVIEICKIDNPSSISARAMKWKFLYIAFGSPKTWNVLGNLGRLRKLSNQILVLCQSQTKTSTKTHLTKLSNEYPKDHLLVQNLHTKEIKKTRKKVFVSCKDWPYSILRLGFLCPNDKFTWFFVFLKMFQDFSSCNAFLSSWARNGSLSR